MSSPRWNNVRATRIHGDNDISATMDPTKAQTVAAFNYLKSQKANKVGAVGRVTVCQRARTC